MDYDKNLKPLTLSQYQKFIEQYGWVAKNNKLYKLYNFTDFKSHKLLIQKLYSISDTLNHHPIVKIEWGVIEIEIFTRDFDNISIQDLRFVFLLENIINKFYTIDNNTLLLK